MAFLESGGYLAQPTKMAAKSSRWEKKLQGWGENGEWWKIAIKREEDSENESFVKRESTLKLDRSLVFHPTKML